MSKANSNTNEVEQTDNQPAAIELGYDRIREDMENDPYIVVSAEYLKAAALLKEIDKPKYQKLKKAVKDTEINTNEYAHYVKEAQDEMAAESSRDVDVSEPPELEAPDGDVPTFSTVLDTVESELGHEARRVAEVCLSSTATMLIDGIDNWPGVIIEGDSGCGKTTLIECLYPYDLDISHHAHRITPAAFLSADSSRDGDELQAGSLYRRINGKVLVMPEMARLFAGGEDRVRDTMSTFAGVMDGNNYDSETGTQDYQQVEDSRAGMIGATTPIPPSGWRMMGKTGNRFLFAEYPADTSVKGSEGQAAKILEGPEYADMKQNVRDVAVPFLRGLWDSNGGFEGVHGGRLEVYDGMAEHIDYLGALVAHGRATVTEAGEIQRESPRRVKSMLINLVRGRALLDGRTHVQQSDMEVAAYAALSTIPRKRRALVRELLRRSPEDKHSRGLPIDGNQAENIIDVSHKTALDRLREIRDLGIGDTAGDNSRDKVSLEVEGGFRWPDGLSFPDM